MHLVAALQTAQRRRATLPHDVASTDPMTAVAMAMSRHPDVTYVAIPIGRSPGVIRAIANGNTDALGLRSGDGNKCTREEERSNQKFSVKSHTREQSDFRNASVAFVSS